MSTEDYLKRMAGLGIGRGALAESFPCEDGTCTLAQREPNLINERGSVKVRAATVGLVIEDLAHLNPANSANIARGVSERAARRRAGRRDAGPEARSRDGLRHPNAGATR